MFEFGDTNTIGLEDSVQAIENSGLPVGNEIGFEIMLAAQFGLADFAAQILQHDLSLELGIAIRQFAKGQLTWFKRDRRIIWLDPFGDYFQEACDRIREWEG